MIKITMDSGKEYEIDNAMERFISIIQNEIGVVKNGFVAIGNRTVINPSHISSIENLEEHKQNINLEGMKNLSGIIPNLPEIKLTPEMEEALKNINNKIPMPDININIPEIKIPKLK